MKHTWTGFLKAQGSPEARILLAIGGAQPKLTKARIDTLFKYGDISEDSYVHRLEVYGELYELYVNRGSIDPRGPGDWMPINNVGGRMRRTHLNSDGDRSYD